MANPIRLYLDEDAQQLTLVRALRARQIDVLTVNEAGLTSLPDGEQLAYASASGRVIFTFNRGDFVRLHKLYLQMGQSHTGIIVSDQLQMGVIIPRLLKLLAGRSAEEMVNWLEFLSRWR